MKKRLPGVLAHEQLHFDITEIFARKLYADVSKRSAATKDELNQLFQEANNECDKMQQEYDQQTDHGTIEDKQARWSDQVSQMLQTSKSYPAAE